MASLCLPSGPSWHGVVEDVFTRGVASVAVPRLASFSAGGAGGGAVSVGGVVRGWGAACKEFLQKKGLLADSEFVDDAIWERRALIPTPEGERTEEGRPQKARRGFFGRLFGRR